MAVGAACDGDRWSRAKDEMVGDVGAKRKKLQVQRKKD